MRWLGRRCVRWLRSESDNGRYGIFRMGRADHSALILAARITLPHFSVSSATSRPKSPELIGIGSAPNSMSLGIKLGSARLALISLLSFSMVSAGVALGAPMPYQ